MSCSRNPCGQNTRCQDVEGGYKCTCLPGCTGDPTKGCLCEALRTDYCKNQICGTNALCRLHNGRDPQCYCPPDFPVGDPNIHCKLHIPVDLKASPINHANRIDSFTRAKQVNRVNFRRTVEPQDVVRERSAPKVSKRIRVRVLPDLVEILRRNACGVSDSEF